MRLSNGPHNQTPIAGIANLKIFPTEGASSISLKLVLVVVVDDLDDAFGTIIPFSSTRGINLSPLEDIKDDLESVSSNFVENNPPIIVD